MSGRRPVRGSSRRLTGRQALMRNQVDFVHYRKYGAETELKFESDEPKPKK